MVSLLVHHRQRHARSAGNEALHGRRHGLFDAGEVGGAAVRSTWPASVRTHRRGPGRDPQEGTGRVKDLGKTSGSRDDACDLTRKKKCAALFVCFPGVFEIDGGAEAEAEEEMQEAI